VGPAGQRASRGAGRWARGGRWERARARRVREPGWRERRSELGCGAGPGELLGRGGERAAREKGRREWAGGLLAQEERRGAPWAEEVGRERERRQAGLG